MPINYESSERNIVYSRGRSVSTTQLIAIGGALLVIVAMFFAVSIYGTKEIPRHSLPPPPGGVPEVSGDILFQ